jgi:hypothetical protein
MSSKIKIVEKIEPDYQDISRHLRNELEKCNWSSKKCSTCGWIDHEMEDWSVCSECGDYLCEFCVDGHKGPLICEFCHNNG